MLFRSAEADRRTAIEATIEAQTHSATTTQAGIQVAGAASIIQIKTIAATKEQTQALKDLLIAQNAYTAGVAKSLDTVAQWNNYLAILVDSYQNGSTSLLAYRQALQMFQTQLEQMFIGATGKAKSALEEMIATIQKLINTAGAGGSPSTDHSLSGELNRKLNKP